MAEAVSPPSQPHGFVMTRTTAALVVQACAAAAVGWWVVGPWIVKVLGGGSVAATNRGRGTPNCDPEEHGDQKCQQVQVSDINLCLHEATADRFIHYLVRPASALGAREVFWVGLMKAKATVRGSTHGYGHAMTREVLAPLTSLATLLQVRREIDERGANTTGDDDADEDPKQTRQFWIGVSQNACDGSLPIASAVRTHADKMRGASIVVLFSDRSEGSVAGPAEWNGRLGTAGERAVDCVVHLRDEGPRTPQPPPLQRSSARDVEEDDEGDAAAAVVSLSAAVAVALHALGTAVSVGSASSSTMCSSSHTAERREAAAKAPPRAAVDVAAEKFQRAVKPNRSTLKSRESRVAAARAEARAAGDEVLDDPALGATFGDDV